MPSLEREILAKVPAFGDEVFFERLVGRDAISACFSYALHLASKNIDLKAEDVLGTTATVTVAGEKSRHFHAHVTEFLVEDIRDDYVHYRLTLAPWLWFLSRRTDNRIFQNMSVPAIVEAVFAAYPQAAFKPDLQKSYPEREYCVQYGESDLAFVQRLLEHEGIFYYFEHEEEAHRLILTDANAKLKPAPGLETVPYEPDSRVSFKDGDFITEWLPRAEVRTGKYAQTDYDFEKPASDLMSKAENPLRHDADGFENYHYPGNYVALSRGDGLSSVRLEELQAPHRRVQAKGTARGLWPGHTFKLDLFPREAENDEYIVLGAEYEAWDDQYRTGRRVDSTGYQVTLDLAPASLPFRPARTTPRPQMKGPQTAVVVGPGGAEIFTDKYSRVKVQFHWDRHGGNDENSSCFVRVSSVWAGSGWGFIQIPRIGQEVIVDFLEGDPDQPIITGRVYNAMQMPPYGLPGSATQSGWKSNSSPGGGGWNELRFEDKAGSEEVYFQAQKDHNELVKNNESRTIGNDFAEDVGHDAQQSVGNNRTESVGNDKAVTVGNNRTVQIGTNDDETVGSNRSLTVGSNETISIGANSTESIGANHSQTVGASQSVTVAIARTDTVGAAETRTVGAAQTMAIGAARTVTVGSGQTHSVGADDGWTVGGGQSVTVGGDQSVAIGGGQTVNVSADQAMTIGGGRASDIGADDMLKVAGEMGVNVGKKFVLDVKDEITLKCGSALVSMKKDGTIVIEGKDITVKGSGKINLKASGDITAKGSKINMN